MKKVLGLTKGHVEIIPRNRVDTDSALDHPSPSDQADLPASPAGDQGFGQIIEASDDAVIVHRDGKIIYANPAALERAGAGATESLIGRSVLGLVDPRDRPKLAAGMRTMIEPGRHAGVVGCRWPDVGGGWRDIEMTMVEIAWNDGPAIVSVCRDVTGRKRMEMALETSEARFRAFAEHSPEATIAVCERRLVLANRAAAKLLGAERPQELIGLDVLSFCDPTMRNRAASYIAILELGGAVPRQLRGRLCCRDGRSINVEWTSIPFAFGGKPAAYLIIRDVTRKLEAEERHRYLASHDALTGLPNRLEFQRRLKTTIERAGSEAPRFAVHYLDLDHFKSINDSLGHQVGDKLLQFVAARLEGAVRISDMVARLGGDEFAVLQTEIGDTESPWRLAAKLLRALEQPYTVGDHLLHISVTIGIAVFPDHGDHPDQLLRRADLALYHAKETGRNSICVFSEHLDRRIKERDILVTELVHAEARGEFDIYFQPIACLRSGRIEAVEALLRWHHPRRGLLAADDFIHAIETSRESQRLGAWILHKACTYARNWTDRELAHLRVTVNLCMPLLQRPDLVDLVRSILDESRLEPSRLELELTEHMIVTAGAAGVTRKLLELHQMGVRIALDDFGTGFSSLALLKDLPVDRIKIDRSFVAGFGSNDGDTAIVHAITNLGRSMNKRVTAEGVESGAMMKRLRSAGCHEIQGFHLARPMPADQLSDFLNKTIRATTR